MTEHNNLAIVETFENKLSTAVENGEKKIPQYQKRDIIAMKEEHLGNLKSQVMYLKSNKKTEFKQLYDEEIKNHKEGLNLEYEKLNDSISELREKFDKTMVETYLKEVQNIFGTKCKEIESLDFVSLDVLEGIRILLDLDTETKIEREKKRISDNLRSRLRNSFNSPITLNKSFPDYSKVTSLLFELEYGDFYKNAKIQIEKLEKLFVESLNFNDLTTAYGVYTELKKADHILEKVQKFKTPKIDVNFDIYLDEKKLKKLEGDVERKKEYEFIHTNN